MKELYRAISTNERRFLEAIALTGDAAFGVEKLGNGWTWGTELVKSPNTIFATKRAALDSAQLYASIVQELEAAEREAIANNRVQVAVYRTPFFEHETDQMPKVWVWRSVVHISWRQAHQLAIWADDRDYPVNPAYVARDGKRDLSKPLIRPYPLYRGSPHQIRVIALPKQFRGMGGEALASLSTEQLTPTMPPPEDART